MITSHYKAMVAIYTRLLEFVFLRCQNNKTPSISEFPQKANPSFVESLRITPVFQTEITESDDESFTQVLILSSLSGIHLIW